MLVFVLKPHAVACKMFIRSGQGQIRWIFIGSHVLFQINCSLQLTQAVSVKVGVFNAINDFQEERLKGLVLNMKFYHTDIYMLRYPERDREIHSKSI